MPTPANIPPDCLKKIVESQGFREFIGSPFNSVMRRREIDPLILLPKDGGLVSIEILMHILRQLKIDMKTYWILLARLC